jgi:hypothetical protein
LKQFLILFEVVVGSSENKSSFLTSSEHDFANIAIIICSPVPEQLIPNPCFPELEELEFLLAFSAQHPAPGNAAYNVCWSI